MKKRRIYTMLGIALAFLIAFGGWAVTDALIAGKENALLSTRGSILINTQSGNSFGNTPPDAGTPNTSVPITIINNYPKLNASEIYEVLVGWELPGKESPHEPTERQLNMEQAIAVAGEWLATFCGNDLIPEAAREYDKTNAYLALNEISEPAEMIALNPLVSFDEIRDEALLEPFCSYWTVSFSGGTIDTTLIINAGTGQIWKAEIVSKNANVNFDGISESELLAAFTEYIDVDGADGIINITTKIIPGTLDGKTVLAKVELSLSAIWP
jgi:hypothetical protein